jgi:hypothetical protein
MFFCKSDVQPQRDLGAQASPSRTRSLDHEVGAQTLVDDTRTATPPLAADTGTRDSVGDVGTSTSPYHQRGPYQCGAQHVGSGRYCRPDANQAVAGESRNNQCTGTGFVIDRSDIEVLGD